MVHSNGRCIVKKLDFFGPPPVTRVPAVLVPDGPSPLPGGLTRYAYRTHSGKILDFADPEHATIDIEDIAHNLARVCRFGGAVDDYYSVASHCVYVSRELEAAGSTRYVQAAGLLHDAAEAYLGDVVSGLKRLLPDYKSLELRWEARIQEHFGVYWAEGRVAREVKDADLRARLSEVRDLFDEYPYPREALLGGEGNREPYTTKCVAATPDVAEWAWLARARELGLW